MSNASQPLVSFVLMAYNQEQFIHKALDGAFSQNYTPLEIIISDDCSTDHTFEIIQKIVAGYRGPHKIILNQSHENLGIGKHLNTILPLASGAIIIMAAGDDVSFPNRSSILVKNWLSNGMPDGIGSGYEIIDESGRFISDTPQRVRSRAPLINAPGRDVLEKFDLSLNGCGAAWTKKLWDFFGPFNGNVTCEDDVLYFRSLLLGGVFFVDEELLQYRTHSRNVSNRMQERNGIALDQIKRKVMFDCEQESIQITKFAQMLVDLQLAWERGCVDSMQKDLLCNKIDKCRKRAIRRAEWWNMSPMQRISARVDFFSSSRFIRLAAILPLPVYIVILYLREILNKIKSLVKFL